MKPKELREKTDDELEMELETLRKGLFNLRFRKVTDVVENPSEFRRYRRDIARILTILGERRRAAEEGQ
ncbi:MAG: 50S ribosomal protein L29 [Planctomycetota bacterium]|jgi:large subunit ribosomal protein L29